MKLTKEQKEDLRGLTNHAGFKILEGLTKELENTLFSKFKKADLAKDGVGQDLVNNQNMLAGAEYLLNTAKESTQEIVIKK